MSNIEVRSAVHGIAPRSDDLLRLGGDVERGRASPDEYETAVKEETVHWLSVQEAAGITYTEDGKLRWADHLRPIIKATEGFAPDVDQAPITRWFATNTFYRRPTIQGELRFDPIRYEEQVGTPGENISLLAPYSFSTLCDHDRGEPRIDYIGQLYDQLLEYIRNQDTRRLVLEEPAECRPFDTVPIEQACRLAGNFPALRVAYLQNGRSATVVPRQLPENLDVRFDTTSVKHMKHRPPPYRPHLRGHELWQPVIDADNTLEDKLDCADWPLDVLYDLQPASIVLTHTVDLERLPLPYAEAKVRRLGAFAAAVQNHLNQEEL